MRARLRAFTFGGNFLVMANIERIIESPYTALVIALVLGGLALSGKFSVTATQILLAVALVVVLSGLRAEPCGE
jgi:hypothetical protein